MDAEDGNDLTPSCRKAFQAALLLRVSRKSQYGHHQTAMPARREGLYVVNGDCARNDFLARFFSTPPRKFTLLYFASLPLYLERELTEMSAGPFSENKRGQ